MTAVAEPVGSRARRWEPWALGAICAVAALLYLWGIGSSWGNSYYSAAVKSMSQSFEAFFFGSFDPVGVVTVDKPPMALWLQVLSVEVFGFNRFAVLLPQAAAGVAAVFLLHRAVRRWAGEHAALLAALVLALSPITVVINRDNNPDTLLVLLVVAAACAMTRAFESRRATGWVALAAFLVGCGFLTKMLQAWMVLPAFIAAYWLGGRAGWARRLLDLGIAAVVLLVSSFWWVAVTALWPSPKPFIGGSEDGSAWDLVFGYNGFGRIFGAGGGPGGGFSGSAGLLRMANEQLAGQISWLLPLCALVLVSVLAAGIRRLERARLAGWVLWGGWLVVIGLMFSFAQGIMHPYYTTMLAPAVGAVTGAGLVRFWHWYREPGARGWLLPIGVAITVAWAMAVVARDLSWHAWAGYSAAGLGIVALVVLLLGRRGRARLAKSGLALGLAAILLVPTAWSSIAAVSGESGMGGTNPMAGPETGMGGPGPMRFGAPPDGGGLALGTSDGRMPELVRSGPGGASLSAEQRKLVDYVRAQAGELTVPLAIEGGSMAASSYLLNSDLTVIGMGGFSGGDDAPSVAQLTEWEQSGELGFVLLGGGPGGMRSPDDRQPPGAVVIGPGGQARSDRQEWVEQNCTPVDPAAWGGSADGLELYSCGSAGDR
ncbi:4-amino-4-deoxy-L-arabinose transferase [Saccharopolyspora kobensis]|uniref:4-amino-4-deoxy-L-arabinose transferase n=1 Tax=Saccharopolyspora kobensis TaxID=146035 RepID=A0A1H6BP04_9PSEU|nr:glycosyltransferase family 39 protein [Saccharopolyspora kobensis]SEG62438.1 4-amino-4-deoxy-L-arabinose transferase [Saccharopolyspora kobensis]SFE84639.1 4-amino-4-deoxy-L-arabinose transferase [Saccharopolyspora kobensis]